MDSEFLLILSVAMLSIAGVGFFMSWRSDSEGGERPPFGDYMKGEWRRLPDSLRPPDEPYV